MSHLIGLVGVGAYIHGPSLICPLHKLGKDAVDGALRRGEILVDEDANDIGRGCFDFTGENFA